MYKRQEEGPGTEFVVGFHRAGFQKLKDHWEEVRAKMAEANTEDFVVFQGYEMHSGAFGDHHVLTRNDRMVLQDCETPEELVEVCGPGAVAVPHHIGYTPGYRGIDWGKFNSRISPVAVSYTHLSRGSSKKAESWRNWRKRASRREIQ